MMRNQANRDGKVLRALGEDVELMGEVFGLRELVEDYAPTVDRQTAEAVQTNVRRFIELHGDLPLNQIGPPHLREFIDAVAKLPKVQSSASQRKMDFLEMIADAKRRKLELVGFMTRRRAFDMMKSLMAHGVSRGFVANNVWTASKLKAPKAKFSKAKPRRPFKAEEARRVLIHIKTSNHPQFARETIDRWAPWIAAYHGLRIQEASQLKVADFALRDGVQALQITDAGEGQRAKTQSTVRWVPLHPRLIEEGLLDLVEERRASGEDVFVLRYWHRYRKRIVDLEEDSRGRVSGAYSKRFASLLDRLSLSDPGLVFHSWRHRLQDVADTVGIPESHRRYLTGRANKNAAEGAYGEGAALGALLESLSKLDPLA